jgi:MFS family permease
MKYYIRLTILLGLLWGFIAIQRIVIQIIMPAIQADMKFTYTDVGFIIAITGFVWAFGTVIWAAIGDKYGRRPVIAVTAFLAAVFSWVTGLVHGLGGMLAVRGVLGFFEGGPWSPIIATLSEEAPPKKRAMVVGFIPGSFFLIGVFAGPMLAVWLLGAFGSWRPVFYILSLPAALLGILTLFLMHEAPSVAESLAMKKRGEEKVVYDEGKKVRMVDVLKYKNVIVSAVNSIPIMALLWIYTGFSGLFLVKVHQMTMGQMSFAMAASGLGGFLGMPIMGLVSDNIGRRSTMILTGFLAAIAGFIIAVLPVGTPVAVFCIPFFFWGFFGIGTFPMYLGTLPTESVPPEFAGTAVSIPTGVGEIIGAAVMPTVAGILADKFGLFAPIWMATLACLAVCVVSVFYVETAPKKLSKMKIKPTRDDHLLSPFRGRPAAASKRPY